jgi:hypothetical protein
VPAGHKKPPCEEMMPSPSLVCSNHKRCSAITTGDTRSALRSACCRALQTGTSRECNRTLSKGLHLQLIDALAVGASECQSPSNLTHLLTTCRVPAQHMHPPLEAQLGCGRSQQGQAAGGCEGD